MIDLDQGDDLDRVASYRGGIPQHGISPDEKEDQNRLTVGQRIGGAIKQPSYMAKTSQADDAL